MSSLNTDFDEPDFAIKTELWKRTGIFNEMKLAETYGLVEKGKTTLSGESVFVEIDSKTYQISYETKVTVTPHVSEN